VSEELWAGPVEPVEPISCSLGLMAHPFELPACPSNDIGIDPFQGRTQLRLVEVAVVGDPTANARIVHPGQIGQGFVAAFVKRPASDFPADARQRLRAAGWKLCVKMRASPFRHIVFRARN